MTTIHDDRPHPIPDFAYLRYKENYFFIIMDPEREVFGISHLNNEPLFNRSRFTLNMCIRGENFAYANEIPLPATFEMAEELSDGRLSVRFVTPHKRIDLIYRGDDYSADIIMEGRRPTFDYSACRTGAPELPSFQDIMTLGLNLPYNHQQQSLSTRGRIVLKKGSKELPIEINGWGYRDHSWVFRGDTTVRQHFWVGLNFPDRAFGLKTLETFTRPGLWAKEGYVSDREGERVLRVINVTQHGRKGGWPEKVRFEVRDVFGKAYTIEGDVAGRYADVPLQSEKPQPGKDPYRVFETCCPLTLLETGEKGVGLIEMGRHPSVD